MRFTYRDKKFDAVFWKGEQLSNTIAADTETALIEGPWHVPPLVTFQVYDGNNNVYFIKLNDTKKFLEQHKNAKLIFHNAPFDLAVLSKETGFDFNDQILTGKIIDTSILYRLVELANKGFVPKKYSLDKIAKELLNHEVDKNEEIRLNFGQYRQGDRIAYEKIEKSAYTYAAIDSIVTHRLYMHLYSTARSLSPRDLLSHTIQLLGAIGLDAIAKNGIGFSQKKKQEFLDQINPEIKKHEQILASYGWLRGIPGIQERYESIVEFLRIDLPRTGKSQKVSSKAEHLEKYRHIPFIDSYIKFHEYEKTKSFFEDIDGDRIYPRYTHIMNTGRTSCSQVNIQQLPRAPGVRELFVPKEGHVFLDIDYTHIELNCLAQICYKRFGKSVLGDKLNEGFDPHTYAASQIYKKKYEDVTKEERQLAKILNFGFAANMSSDKFVDYAKTYDVEISPEESAKLKATWSEIYPEVQQFWRAPPEATSVTLTGRRRAACKYTAYLNTQFQGLAADGAKIALYSLCRAGYKVVAFIHDQVLIEYPEKNAKKALENAQQIMVDSMKKVLPDVIVETEGQILFHFVK